MTHPASLIARFAVRRPWLVASLILLTTLAAVWVTAERLRFDDSLVSTVSFDTPEGRLAAKIDNTVTDQEGRSLLVVVHGADLLKGETFEALQFFEEELRFVEDVDRVVSIFGLNAAPPVVEGQPIALGSAKPLFEVAEPKAVFDDSSARRPKVLKGI